MRREDGDLLYSQIRLGYIEYGVPCIKAMLDENVQILTKTEFLEDIPQFSHTAELYLAQHVQRYDVRNYPCRTASRRPPCLSRRRPPKTFSIVLDDLQNAVESLGVTSPRCNAAGAARREQFGGQQYVELQPLGQLL